MSLTLPIEIIYDCTVEDSTDNLMFMHNQKQAALRSQSRASEYWTWIAAAVFVLFAAASWVRAPTDNKPVWMLVVLGVLALLSIFAAVLKRQFLSQEAIRRRAAAMMRAEYERSGPTGRIARNVLRITETGIECRHANTVVVSPWSDVDSVAADERIIQLRGSQMIFIPVRALGALPASDLVALIQARITPAAPPTRPV